MKKKNKKHLLPRLKADVEDLERYIEEFSLFLPLAVFILNPKSIFIDANKSALKLCGYNDYEIIGEKIEFLFKDKKKARIFFRKVSKEKKRAETEMILLDKKNRQVPVNISLAPRMDDDGDIVGFFMAVSDITESKKFQENLENKVKERTKDLEKARVNLAETLEQTRKAKEIAEEEESKTKAILFGMDDGLIFFDKENKLALMNTFAKNLLGFKQFNALSSSFSELSRNRRFKAVADAIGPGLKKVFRKPVVFEGEDATEISTFAVGSGRKRIGRLVVFHDVARERAMDKIKSEFISVAAHQLRTPLSSVKWVLKMILDGDFGDITPKQKEFIGRGYASNERMIQLVNDLLDVSRIEEGQFGFKFTSEDFNNFSAVVASNFRDAAERSGVKLTINVGKTPLFFSFDVQRMEVVLSNLLDNAIRYTSSGGEVSFSVSAGEKGVIVSVRDTGVGIPEKQKSRVFTKFFRGDNVVRMQTEGTGLGLYLSKNITEKHGGKISFESEEGKGTVFNVFLPFKTKYSS
ncbi:MAG: PAS domain-containing sensor histidine kinase [Candidatus Pacebacteria bacterium]|nr:PAS domain-containing sensor histidine kinase [Candidatus Paceibacterota bacterium]